MKPLKTKRNIRDEINQQIEDFIRTGGKVNSVPNGVSGNESNENLFKNSTNFTPKQSRTPLNDVVKELEERKSAKTATTPARKKRAKKVLVKDDFGEPLRWVWEE